MKKAIEMKIIYMIIALLLLIWAILFIGSLREGMFEVIGGLFG